MRYRNDFHLRVFALSVCCLCAPAITWGDAFALETGVSRNDLPLDLQRKMWEAPGGPYLPDVLFVDDANRAYWLHGKKSIGLFDFESSRNLAGWRLSRWEHEYLEPEVRRTYSESELEWGGVYLAEELRRAKLMGCMEQVSPLRYGDVTGNGEPDLLILIGNEASIDVAIFSLSAKEVIFSSKLNFTDDIALEDIPEDYRLRSKTGDYQYVSWRSVAHSVWPIPGMRAYGKVYVGDFNEDDSQDLVVWRKLYESKKSDDQVRGFLHVRDTLLHYNLVDDRYVPQETEPAVVKGWLSANDLTWQDGFPTKSECPGHEGELIPEMHDPLLNDPEVLK